jgi:hypothetical protein
MIKDYYLSNILFFELKVLINIPIGMINQIVKVGGQTLSRRNDGASYGIEIICKVKNL